MSDQTRRHQMSSSSLGHIRRLLLLLVTVATVILLSTSTPTHAAEVDANIPIFGDADLRQPPPPSTTSNNNNNNNDQTAEEPDEDTTTTAASSIPLQRHQTASDDDDNDVAAAAAAEDPVLTAKLARFQEMSAPPAKPSATPAPSPTGPDATTSIACDLTAQGGVCLFDGQKILVPDAIIHNTVARYTFDDAHALDSSGHALHAQTPCASGPGRGGYGASCNIGSSAFMSTPANAALETLATQFTLSFWVFLQPTASATNPQGTLSDAFCPLIYYGNPTANKTAMAIELKGNGGLLRATTGAVTAAPTTTHLKYHRWYHIGFVRSNAAPAAQILYVNGVPVGWNTATTITANVCAGAGCQLFVGGRPNNAAECASLSFLADDLTILGDAHPDNFFEAMSGQALGTVHPNMIRFGCENCTYADAKKSCPPSYRVCYENEGQMGAWAAAYTMGWGSYATKFCTHIDMDEQQTSAVTPTPLERCTAICCHV